MLEHEELVRLRRMMEKRRAKLALELRADAAKVREDGFASLTGEVRDAGDEAGAELLTEVERKELDRDLQEVRALEAALERLSNGKYGQCTDCRVDIGFERLRAEPAALRCIECQARHEKMFVQPRSPKL